MSKYVNDFPDEDDYFPNEDIYFDDEDYYINKKIENQNLFSTLDSIKLAENNLNNCLHEMGLPTHFEQIVLFKKYLNKIKLGVSITSFIGLSIFFPLYKVMPLSILTLLIIDYSLDKLINTKYDILEKISHYKMLKGNFFSRKKTISKALEKKDNFYSIIYYMDIMNQVYSHFITSDKKIKNNELKTIYLFKNILNDMFIKKDMNKLTDFFFEGVYPIIQKFEKSKEYGNFLLENDFKNYVNNSKDDYIKDKLTQTLHNPENPHNFENVISLLIKGKKEK